MTTALVLIIGYAVGSIGGGFLAAWTYSRWPDQIDAFLDRPGF